MNLVDSCGWLEYFADGPNASFFAKPIEKKESVLVPTLCLFEVYKRLLQQHGEETSIKGVAAMRQGIVIPLNDRTAIFAAQLSLEHKIPLADSIILATAVINKAMIWTQDSDFENLPGVQYIKK